MKRTLSLALVLLCLTLAGTLFVNVARANPTASYYSNGGSIPSNRVGAEPPTITVSYLQNSSFYNNNITFTLNATIGNSAVNSSRWIDLVYYSVDWQQKNYYVYRYMNDELNPASYATNLNLTGINGTQIPEGKHTLKVNAIEQGQYLDPPISDGFGLKKIVYYTFQITGTTSVTFTIDRTVPKVLLLSIENKTYSSRDIPLNFTVNEPTSKFTYNLDNKGNTTIAGNTTLTSLSVGSHNLTVYNWDKAGNAGASEIVYFSVEIPEPLPTVPVAAVSVLAITLVAAGSMIYYKKHKKGVERVRVRTSP
jgi:hypothetical protein